MGGSDGARMEFVSIRTGGCSYDVHMKFVRTKTVCSAASQSAVAAHRYTYKIARGARVLRLCEIKILNILLQQLEERSIVNILQYLQGFEQPALLLSAGDSKILTID